MKRFILFILPLFLLSSCIDIIDDLTINNDGSGRLKLGINLSKSKLEVNSVLALDSLYGQRVPKLNEVSSSITKYAEILRHKKGITEVKVEKDTVNFNFKFYIDFEDVEDVEAALKEIVKEEDTRWVNLDFDWVKWENHVLTRNNIKIPEEQLRKLKYDDIQKLKQGTYTSITRFQNPIIEYTNQKSKLTPNKLNLMIQTSAYLLAEDTQSIKNNIKTSTSPHK